MLILPPCGGEMWAAKKGEAPLAKIVHQVREGKVVTVGGVVTEVIERDGHDLLVVDGSNEPLLALPRW
jgi:hypothetical protein